jgi:hypothetical protein
MNQEHPKFEGAARSLYGSRGPVQAANTGRQRRPLSGPPESLEHYIDDSLARVADLTARQRTAVKAEMMRTMRDIDFLKTLMDSAKARGPWSQAAVQPTDEGRII